METNEEMYKNGWQSIIVCNTCRQTNWKHERDDEKDYVTCSCGHTHCIEMNHHTFLFEPSPFLWFRHEPKMTTVHTIHSRLVTTEYPYNGRTEHLIDMNNEF